MFSQPLLMASRSAKMRKAITAIPVTRRVVGRFVAGETLPEVVAITEGLLSEDLTVTIDNLGEDTLDVADAIATREAYVALLSRLADLGLGRRAEVSLKLSALGQSLPSGAEQVTLDNALAICQAAEKAGTTVTIDMEDHTTIDRTLGTVTELRRDFPWVGAVLQSMLLRTEADCRDLATAGSRIRLVKGAYLEPESVAFQDKKDVDLAYVRCLRTLMHSEAYPMPATHDLRMIEIGQQLAADAGRAKDSYEFQMLYGIRPAEQRQLSREGHTVRVYLPYGTDWYGYFMRRLAERPANVGFFLRALVSK
ncbi:proline dehydrogenase family protein [Longispora albida]|uniref:proline dehydrogenase family protein n=1 Tax=Longispora albida TaxID=203523 RepID=UPI00036445D1|nr:proline dehydrogenase family protein [Longispora albida]